MLDKSPEINEQEFTLLVSALKNSFGKKGLPKHNTSSLAMSVNGTTYSSGQFESQTHLLNISSESAALCLSVSNKDPHISQVITLVEHEENFQVNPLIIKILADHVARTGTVLSYAVFNMRQECIYSLEDVHSTYYQPNINPIEKIHAWKVQKNSEPRKTTADDEEYLQQLFTCAKRGCDTHFTSNTTTLYGASVATSTSVYFAGVYSAFDHRLNVHAEMSAAISSFAVQDQNITDIAVVSTKFPEVVCEMCGCCRQFFTEMQQSTKTPIRVHLFSFDGRQRKTIKLDDYLPGVWSST